MENFLGSDTNKARWITLTITDVMKKKTLNCSLESLFMLPLFGVYFSPELVTGTAFSLGYLLGTNTINIGTSLWMAASSNVYNNCSTS